jgi:multidrug efflux pump subunit AcrB
VTRRPEVVTVLTTIGAGNDPVTKGNVLVKLVKKDERKKGVDEIISEVRNELRFMPGAHLSYQTAHIGGGSGEKPVTMSVRGEDFSILQRLAGQVESIMRSTPGAVDVESSFEASKPEVRLRVDRDKASDLGINVGLVATTVRALVDGYVATKYQEGEDQYDVRVRLRKEDRSNLRDVADLFVKSNKDLPNNQKLLVPVSDVAAVTEGAGLSKINRYDRQREIRVDADLSGRLLGDVLRDIQDRVKGIATPSGYSVSVAGQGEMQAESFGNIFVSLAMAILFVYIVLAAQFESFVYPFSIMLALPMAIIGAVLALIVVGGAISVISLIGIILLMGLVTKNGILLVDYTNIQRRQGLDRTAALLKAGPIRLRPILMTTFAMIFGMMPVALAFGENSELRAPMGQAVIGGLITSTFLTLFIVPVVYSILDDLSLHKLVAFFGRLNFLRLGKVKEKLALNRGASKREEALGK